MPRDPPILFLAMQIQSQANGGAESIGQVMMNLRHHRAILITNRDSARTRAWRAAGIETHVVAGEIGGRSLRGNPVAHGRELLRYSRTIARLRWRSGARVLHANDPLAMQLAYPLTRLGLVRTLFCLRGTPDPENPPSARKYRALFDASAHLLFLSGDMARRWGALVPDSATPSSITYSAVGQAMFEQSRQRDERDPFVLLCGRISSLKGQLPFLRHVAPALVARGLRVVIAGDDNPDEADYAAACRQAAELLGERVEFLGFRENVASLYARACLVAIPSRVEGLARAMIEAMACGCPVVSFDVCSADEMLGGGAGRVVASQDWPAMGEAIAELAGDPELRDSMGRAGREQARRLFTGGEVVARYEEAYRTVAGGGR